MGVQLKMAGRINTIFVFWSKILSRVMYNFVSLLTSQIQTGIHKVNIYTATDTSYYMNPDNGYSSPVGVKSLCVI